MHRFSPFAPLTYVATAILARNTFAREHRSTRAVPASFTQISIRGGYGAPIQTLRGTACLLIQNIDIDQAEYWTPENQARIREMDEMLTPELRAEVLAEAIADHAALEQDPEALAEIRAEEALWDSATGDGLDAA
jgi:hypothetical protein